MKTRKPPHNKKHTEQSIIAFLQSIAGGHGGSFCTADGKHDMPQWYACYKVFGSMDAAAKAAGVTYTRHKKPIRLEPIEDEPRRVWDNVHHEVLSRAGQYQATGQRPRHGFM